MDETKTRFIDGKLTTIKTNVNKNEKLDIRFTRMYFSTRNERIGRSILLLSQVITLMVLVINFASLSAYIASELPIHEVINAIGIADAFFRSMLISLTVIGLIICLGFVIPLLTVRDAQGVQTTGQTFLILGTIEGVILFICSIISIVFIPIRFNVLGIIFSIINIGLVIVGSIMLIASSSVLIKKINKAIDDSNDLGELNTVNSKG